MTSVSSKSVRKRIKTTLTVKLMEGKTLRDMYKDFFKGKTPAGFEGKTIKTIVSLDDQSVPYELYKKFSGLGASKEFLESFKFQYVEEYKTVESSVMIESIHKVIPFMTLSGVTSYIQSYTTGVYRLDSSSDLGIEIETYSWKDHITSDQVKHINKENARKLKYYLVGLPSVRGVPYSCTYREDEILEQVCSV